MPLRRFWVFDHDFRAVPFAAGAPCERTRIGQAVKARSLFRRFTKPSHFDWSEPNASDLSSLVPVR
jgi:hypothetical protein